MANRDLVAVGTSAGGVEALLLLIRQLPADFPAAVLVTIHLPSQKHSALPEVLNGVGPLKAAFAAHGERLRRGRVYVAPPGRHLLVDGDVLSLGNGPRENNARPAIDPMLRSAALCCAHRSIGLVLTGTQGDGASGLWALAQCGGATIVQDPKDAAFPEMPLAALLRSKPQHIATLAEMPALLEQLVRQPAIEPGKIPEGLKFEVEVARNGHSSMDNMDRIGRRSVLACPDCHGVLWEIDEGDLTRFRCHVGHAYTEESMGTALDDNLWRALGSALRALEERVALADKMQQDALGRGHSGAAQHWAGRKAEFEAEAEVVRKAIQRADEIDVKEQEPGSNGGTGLS